MHDVIQLGGKRLKNQVSGNIRDQSTPNKMCGTAFDNDFSVSYFYLVLLKTRIDHANACNIIYSTLAFVSNPTA